MAELVAQQIEMELSHTSSLTESHTPSPVTPSHPHNSIPSLEPPHRLGWPPGGRKGGGGGGASDTPDNLLRKEGLC